MSSVKAWSEPVELPTYEPAEPDRNPMFLEKRVYQGSSGRVYPLPYYDRIAEKPTPHRWQAIHLENEYLYVMILPELGGRIHIGRDKTNGYDFFYNQPVIKPALVGLAGPWCSGGVEFNWPQHHRPATFMPVDTSIEAHADGSVTVWCSDHDPMARMKGMHGVCLHPGRAVIELKVRAFNRTEQVQSFLWWANVATRVHDRYQSFFPPDVTYVADHARRSMSEYPLCRGHYYGVDYGNRSGVPPSHGFGVASRGQGSGLDPERRTLNTEHSPPNDLSWYANIPVPTSYMCMGSKEDFFGGYDHAARAGVVHVANHHIAPGKKQWTWGNHPFGHAWDRNLTDPDARGECAPYIELMAGVYTDNQPDFSFLMPGETKSWSQYWYPIREIGAADHADLNAAVSLALHGRGRARCVRLGVSATRVIRQARVDLLLRGRSLARMKVDLSPCRPLVREFKAPPGIRREDLTLIIRDARGSALFSFSPPRRKRGEVPPPATEPPPPAEIATADELFVTGLHLDQYRHATRCPTLYWREALRRDPLDARCNNALGLWHLRRGELALAEACFRRAIERLTRRNANPYDGEAYYNLGLCLRHAGRFEDAYAAFYKSAWNMAWQGPAYHALAELDARRGDWPAAMDHLERALRMNTDNLRARNLKAMALRALGRGREAAALVRGTLKLDVLDPWARWLRNAKVKLDLPTRLDLAHDLARAGRWDDAIRALGAASTGDARDLGVEPMRLYTLGWLQGQRGSPADARKNFRAAALACPDYCFPSRLEDIAVLEAAMRADPKDARAPYYLGNLLYDRRRHEEAIRLWERAARLDASFSVVWRNLGIGYFNIRQDARKACAAYERALRANPSDLRLLFERDQLWKRTGVSPQQRLAELEKHADQVARRDDLLVELCALYNRTGAHEDARRLLATRRFQPWEGGEGQALGQHKLTHLALGRLALRRGDAAQATELLAAALAAPANLGEAWHLLQNQSDTHFWLAEALAAAGDRAGARRHWRIAAEFKGDFQEMSVRAFSELTCYSALAQERLGRKAASRRLLRELFAYAVDLEKAPARIDYFATSLPTMLLFEDDLQARQVTAARFLQAQALRGLGQRARADRLLRDVLKRDPNHAGAAELLEVDR